MVLLVTSTSVAQRAPPERRCQVKCSSDGQVCNPAKSGVWPRSHAAPQHRNTREDAGTNVDSILKKVHEAELGRLAEARLVVTFLFSCNFWGFLVDSVSCDFFCLLVTLSVPLPHEGYQNPCLSITFFGLKLQMLRTTGFAVLYRLLVLCSMKREAHQRPAIPCHANCNPTLLLGLQGFATQHCSLGSGFCNLLQTSTLFSA